MQAYGLAQARGNLCAAQARKALPNLADEIEVLRILLKQLYPNIEIRPPPDLTVAQYTVDFGRLVGFKPTKEQP